MGIPVMIMGESGAGKTCSLRNLDPKKTLLIQPIKKALPFPSRGWKPFTKEQLDGSVYVLGPDQQYQSIGFMLEKAIKHGKEIIVIDDSNYLMTNSSIRRADEKGFQKFVDFAKAHWELILHAQNIQSDARVYFMTHIQTDNEGRQKPKSIGKMLDDQIVIEGLFTIVLGCQATDEQYQFTTKNNGSNCVKTPMGMFETSVIENDLLEVDSAIISYYQIGEEYAA